MNEAPVAVRVVDGLKTGVSVSGAGRPVVALHGWGGSIRSFWPVAERMTSLGYELHLLDMPGFGDSDLPPATWGVSEYMQFVLSYLDEAGLDQVAVLGHSFGGRVAMVLAAEHPERVSKMVLANSAGLRPVPGLKQQLRSLAVRGARATLDRLGLVRWRSWLQNRYNQRFASEDYLTAGALRDTFVRVIEEDLTPYAERVQAPTVLVWGDQDMDTPLWQGRRLEQLIPDAGLVVFHGAGHFSYLDRLNDYVRIVDHFLGEGS